MLRNQILLNTKEFNSVRNYCFECHNVKLVFKKVKNFVKLKISLQPSMLS